VQPSALKKTIDAVVSYPSALIPVAYCQACRSGSQLENPTVEAPMAPDSETLTDPVDVFQTWMSELTSITRPGDVPTTEVTERAWLDEGGGPVEKK
jgi:hypothetical protein